MEWLLLIAVFLAIIGYFQIRCPKCYRVFTRSHLDTEEIDRWQGTKKVESSIKTKDAFNNMKETGRRTEFVPCTYVKLAHYYSCKHCGNQWHKIEKRELK